MKWEEPPPTKVRRRSAGAWLEEARELRANPKRWALLTVFAKDDYSKAANLTRTIRKGYIPAFMPAEHFDATMRTVKGEVRVYAMYTGGES